MTQQSEADPERVRRPTQAPATPTGESPAGAEPSVWTARMVECLRRGGPEGGIWYSLNDKVMGTQTLLAGFARVKANGGAPGVDGVTVEEFEEGLTHEIRGLQQVWWSKTYRPDAVRRVRIPKPGSPEGRPPGIPTVRDRVVQAALRLVLEPIFEATFHPHSYGFRPGRSAHQALEHVDARMRSGALVVVDADLKAFFDSIPHERLLAAVARKVADGRIIDVIRQFLEAGVMENHELTATTAGTPQGGVISPLLANIYLDSLDQEMAQAGWEMVRYADDFVILCRTAEEATRALAAVQDWTARAGLTLHPTKTRIVDMNEQAACFDFLGFRFKRHDKPDGTQRILRLVRDKTVTKAHDAIRAATPRSSGDSWTDIIRRVNAWTRGWWAYFRSVHSSIHHELDGMIRRRLRSILSRRHGRIRHGHGEAHRRWPNSYFDAQGLFSLAQAHLAYLHSHRGPR